MPKIKVNDVNIYYETSGSGPPIVFLAGTSLGTFVWQKVIEILGPGYTSISMDVRGSGRADAPKGLYTIETMVDERAILYRGIKWGSGYIGKDASLIGAIIGYNTEIKDKASVLERAVIGSRSIVKDGIKIHPSVKIMSNEIIDIDQKTAKAEHDR